MSIRTILSVVLRTILFTQFNHRVFAGESRFKITTHQGIGALGRIEPRLRVINVSHNVGIQSARVEQLFVNESDRVKAGDTLAILSDYNRKTAELEAAIAHMKVLEAQRAAEQALHIYNKKGGFKYEVQHLI